MIRKNIFSLTVILINSFLSLAGPETFNNNKFPDIPYRDKLAHLAMYFLLTAVIVAEHRFSIKNIRQLIIVALIPFSVGVLMELLQLFITSNRDADVTDVLFNTAGIVLALMFCLAAKIVPKTGIR